MVMKRPEKLFYLPRSRLVAVVEVRGESLLDVQLRDSKPPTLRPPASRGRCLETRTFYLGFPLPFLQARAPCPHLGLKLVAPPSPLFRLLCPRRSPPASSFPAQVLRTWASYPFCTLASPPHTRFSLPLYCLVCANKGITTCPRRKASCSNGGVDHLSQIVRY